MSRWTAIILTFLAGAAQAAETAYDAAAEGFRAYAAGDYEAAVSAFDRALALDPRLASVAAQRGYALKALHRNREAAQAFRTAIALDETGKFGETGKLGETGRDDIYAREIRILENRFDFSFYTVYRADAVDGDFLAVAGPSLTQSQSGAEIAWTPPGIGYRNGRLVQAYARLLWGYDGDGFRYDAASRQGGVGLRWKPLRTTNLVLSGERLIAIGASARDDWMLRASYSRDRGYAFDGKRARWPYMTFYADAAIIDPGHPDLFLAGEARLGETFRVGRRLAVTPHAMIAAVVQDAAASTTTIVEGGPGLAVKFHGASGALEFLVQYREKIAGSSPGASGVVLTLVAQY